MYINAIRILVMDPHKYTAQSAGAAEHSDCISVEG